MSDVVYLMITILTTLASFVLVWLRYRQRRRFRRFLQSLDDTQRRELRKILEGDHETERRS